MKRILLVAFALSVALLACFEVPLGDPKASKVDHRLDGVWFNARAGSDEVEAWLVAPLDEHVYCVTLSKVTLVDGHVKSDQPSVVFRAWLSSIAGSQFVSLEHIAHLIPDNALSKPFILAKVSFADDGSLQVRGLKTSFKGLSDVKDTNELAKVVKDNIVDPEMFEAPQSLRRPNLKDESEKAIANALLAH